MRYIERDPCKQCLHYFEDYDRHTGVTDCGCDAEQEFAIEETKPCPYFEPSMTLGEMLYEQLAYEEEQKWYQEQEKNKDEEEEE